ncbi:hypothetical protein M2318_005358 [Metapseudomonas resinovorans]|uniref:hypothetical protein n=1 Tax=Metapseudomonas resinovorans TaxID=53412 RepID=UPI003D255241
MDAIKNSRTSKALAWIAATLTSVASVAWAVITYVFPDPTIFGLEAINWKNFLSFFAAFVFMVVIVVAIQARRLPGIFRGAVNLLLAAGLSAIFFLIGMEYAKPSFEFAQEQTKFIENDSQTLLGKRIEMVDKVRISLVDCRFVAQTPSCTFEFNSTNRDRQISINSQTTLFEPNGNALTIERIVVGNTPTHSYDSIELVRDLNTKITLIFKSTREEVREIPSVKLVMSGFENSNQVVKFNEVLALKWQIDNGGRKLAQRFSIGCSSPCGPTKSKAAHRAAFAFPPPAITYAEPIGCSPAVGGRSA